jgi:protein involved in polysaccharide export with SLBB domain
MVRYRKIDVVIFGAVERAGRTALDPGSTVAAALRAAGGLAYRRNAGPAGELVLRRRVPASRSISVYRWNIFEGDSESWRSFRLDQHDVLVFGWSVREDAP